jgi:hypothetical protein
MIEKVVVIWEQNDGCDEEVEGGTWGTVVTMKQPVALNARGRRVLLCDARNHGNRERRFLVSDRVERVIRRGDLYRLFAEPFREVPAAKRYWRSMQRKMEKGRYGAQIMSLPKGLAKLIGKAV